MSFLTPALLAGAALIALPIILHLVMRQEPQRLVFPAMRFIQQRRASNQTRMRLQHWLLLALRCVAIGLLALALARPVLRSGDGEAGETNGLAAALVFDNSPRMGYVQDNRTRLEVAQETADWLVSQLPEDARVAVMGLGGVSSRRLGERDAASMRAEKLTVRADARPLGDAIADAVTLLSEVENARREIYVFTDLSAIAWDETTRQQIREVLDEHPRTNLQLIDVGVQRPINRGLGEIELSSDSPQAGRPLTIRAKVLATNAAPAGAQNVELWLSAGSGPPEKRGETILDPDGAPDQTAAEFNLASLDEGVHQGYLRLLGSDPLAIDDTRHFTVAVEPPRPLLIVAQERAAAIFVSEAIAPSAAGAALRQPIEFLRFDELAPARLDDYAGVLLLDPPGLEDNAWQRLTAFARRGGSVAVFLGPAASRQTHNTAEPQRLLPGPLKRRSRAETYFRPASYQHGVLNQMAEFAEQIPWPRFPVFESWEFESLVADAQIVAPLADDRPALIERPVGEGRVLTFVTPVSAPANGRSGREEPWNLLPTGDDPWPFVLMMGNLADYLVGAGDYRRNFAAGEPAIVPTPPGAAASGFVLRLPSGDSLRQPAPINESEVVVGVTDEVGSYRLLAGGAAGRLDTGFSINASDEVGRLDRITFSEIAEALGADRVELATSRDELSHDVARGRVGREFYPYLIVLVAAALAAEQWVANRFYRES